MTAALQRPATAPAALAWTFDPEEAEFYSSIDIWENVAGGPLHRRQVVTVRFPGFDRYDTREDAEREIVRRAQAICDAHNAEIQAAALHRPAQPKAREGDSTTLPGPAQTKRETR